MKIKIKQVPDTQWIQNAFIIRDTVYLTDATPSNKTSSRLFSVSLTAMNLLMQKLNPVTFRGLDNPLSNDYEAINATEVTFITLVDGFLQNVFLLNEKLYFTTISEDLTACTFDFATRSEITKWKNLVFLGATNNICYFNNIKKQCTVQMNLNAKMKVIPAPVKIHQMIIFEDNLAVLRHDENVVLYTTLWEELKVLDATATPKFLFKINNNNLAIADQKKCTTQTINIKTQIALSLHENTMYRAIILNNKFLFAKDYYNIKGDVSNNILNWYLLYV